MSFLDNLKISYKISAVLALFGAITAFIVVFGGYHMKQIDESYLDLTSNLAPARVEISRTNRELNAIGYAMYRVIAYDGQSTEAKTAATAVEAAFKRASEQLTKLDELDPKARPPTTSSRRSRQHQPNGQGRDRDGPER